MWVANTITPANMQILYIISQTSLKITVSYLLLFFNKTRLVLSLGFWYFELRNIYNEFQITWEFQYSVVSSFIDVGAGLVLRMYMVRSSPSMEQWKHFIIVKLTIWVWYGVAEGSDTISNLANGFLDFKSWIMKILTDSVNCLSTFNKSSYTIDLYSNIFQITK